MITNTCDPQSFARFALSITVSQMSANLCFLKHFKFSKKIDILKMFKNVLLHNYDH